MRFIKKFFANIPSFSLSGKHSLAFLNLTQSLGVVNDNVFKFSMAFLLIHVLGKTEASSILAATGAIYVIPFLLFSSSAGILADRFSKQKLLVAVKIAEVTIMLLAIIAFMNQTVIGCYALLFILSIHSALFSPSKYGIIPELVIKDSVSKANGLITSFTYLSIILGTFLASFLTEITDHNFVLIAAICLLIAIGGLFSALAIKTTKPQGSSKTVNLFFIREIYLTLKYTRTIRHLLPSIFGSSFFLMLGAFTQLNIIPFAIQSLHLNEVAGGYLFLSTAFGIALGAFLAGRASKKKVELGLSCCTGFGIALLFLLLALFSSSLPAVILILFLIGVMGGTFIIPFDTFMQLNSANERRGQTIASANFLGFLGVLLASFFLFFLNTICSLSPASSFFVIGLLTLAVNCFFTAALSDPFLSYCARKILCPWIRCISPSDKILESFINPLFVIEKATWSQALQLTAVIPELEFLIPRTSNLNHWFLRRFHSIHIMPGEYTSEEWINTALIHEGKTQAACLLLDDALPHQGAANTESNFFLNLFKKQSRQIWHVHFKKDPQGATHLGFKRIQ